MHATTVVLGSRDAKPERGPMTPGSGHQATFVLADISGYTRFLEAVGAAHGAQLERGETPATYPLMTTLLDAIVDNLVPPFVLAKLEGDAVFGYAEDGTLQLSGDALTACLRSCHARFREHLRRTEAALTCTCAACVSVASLELKFVLHHGGYVAQTIAGHTELLGPDVTAAHRMLKNDVVATTGWRAYALLSTAAIDYLDLTGADGTRLELAYEHVGHIGALALPLRQDG